MRIFKEREMGLVVYCIVHKLFHVIITPHSTGASASIGWSDYSYASSLLKNDTGNKQQETSNLASLRPMCPSHPASDLDGTMRALPKKKKKTYQLGGREILLSVFLFLVWGVLASLCFKEGQEFGKVCGLKNQDMLDAVVIKNIKKMRTERVQKEGKYKWKGWYR